MKLEKLDFDLNFYCSNEIESNFNSLLKSQSATLKSLAFNWDDSRHGHLTKESLALIISMPLLKELKIYLEGMNEKHFRNSLTNFINAPEKHCISKLYLMPHATPCYLDWETETFVRKLLNLEILQIKKITFWL